MITELTFTSKKKTVNVMDDPDVYLISITGLSPEGVINTSSISGYDGSTVVSSQTPERKIEMVLGFKGDDAEAAKERLYLLFAPKSIGVMNYKSSLKERRIEYISSTSEIVLTEYPMRAQISLLCPDPYFKDIDPVGKIMSTVTPMFKFPFTFNGPFKFGERMASVIENFVNGSTVDVYPIIEFKAISALTNPSIMNINTYEKMKVNVSLSAGEKLRIDTRIGKKSITKISGSEETNCFNSMAADFKFFSLYMGDNYLKYDADTNPSGLQTTVLWENLYGGV